MALMKLDFLPGVNKENTPYTNEGGWIQSDKIRFRSGKPEKIGGWDKYIPDQLTGIARALHLQRTLDGTIYLAIGTNEKVYIEGGGTLTDITPIRETQALSGPFDTTAGSAVITVNDTAHGADDGAWVTISGSTDVDGIPAAEINTEHKITYVDADSYTITVTTTASAGGSGGGGASVSAAYQINPGQINGIYQYGWGAGQWNRARASGAGWNRPAAVSGVALDPRVWHFESWGEDMIMGYIGGSLYLWDATNPLDRATQITQAPHKVSHFVVTSDRHLVCFGCNVPGTASAATELDSMQIRWCQQEDYTDCTVTSVNTAGDQLLTGGTEIMAAANTESQVLIWTDDTVHAMQYIGPPYTFGFSQAGTASGIVSSNAWAAYNNVVYWMGDNAFYIYQGGTSVHPCTVQRYVFNGLDDQQKAKVHASLDRENHEITWFYPATSVGTRTLNGAISASDTTITVSSTAGYALTGSIQIDNETIDYTGKTDASFTGCTRGARGTVAAAHDDESTVSNPDLSNWSYEPYHYVSFGLIDQLWWLGKLERTAWVDRGAFPYPIATGPNGYLFEHEKGYDADGEPMFAQIVSGDFDIGEGDSLMFINRVIPDFTIDGGSVDLKFQSRYYPLSNQVRETVGTVTSSTTKIDTRIRGRQLALSITSKNLGDWWKYGSTRIDQRTDGRR